MEQLQAESEFSMGFKLAILVMRVAEVIFFTGLAGCAVTIILSWIYVGKDSLSKESNDGFTRFGAFAGCPSYSLLDL